MWIKVRIDIRQPLKTQKKVLLRSCGGSDIKFKYERLRTICFVCGCIGHSDRTCDKALNAKDGALTKQ